MVFSSLTFVTLFLPVYLAVYLAVPRSWRIGVILIGSYVFYGWWQAQYLGLLLGVSVWTYVCTHQIDRRRPPIGMPDGDNRPADLWLTACLVGNLAILSYFKYFELLFDTLRTVVRDSQGVDDIGWSIVLPIGISFFTFQAMSYAIDVRRRDTPPARSFVHFAAYVALFPQLIAGPIVRYKEVASQLVHREHTVERFNRGAQRFAIGFAKKVLIADGVGHIADLAFASDSPSMADAWLGTFAYAIQLYFDFSGYSDMALGLGLMMGFTFPENFDRPYTSASITEFWRRWHMSLSRWLRDYLYIPLGGNRRGVGRTYINILATMALGGLWHGAAWTFLAWGLWHGILLMLERAIYGRDGPSAGRRSVGVFVTFLLVMLGWVLFRADDFAGAAAMYAGMVGAHGLALSSDIAWQIDDKALVTLAIATLIVWRPAWLMRRLTWVPQAPVVAIVFAIAVLELSASTYSPFLYFQF